jgi:hypothetical protein
LVALAYKNRNRLNHDDLKNGQKHIRWVRCGKGLDAIATTVKISMVYGDGQASRPISDGWPKPARNPAERSSGNADVAGIDFCFDPSAAVSGHGRVDEGAGGRRGFGVGGRLGYDLAGAVDDQSPHVGG